MQDGQKLQEAVDAVKQHGSITNAANALAIPRKTLSGRYNKAIDLGYSPGGPALSIDQEIAVDSKLKRLAQEKRETEKKYQALLKVLEKKDHVLSEYEAVASLIDDDLGADPIRVTTKTKKKSESTVVLPLSDIHYEELVDPATINNLNKHNPQISTERFNKYFENAVRLIDMSRSNTEINTLILWLGGDFINGYIHEEMVETNAMSPPDACIKVFSLIIAGIDFLIEHAKVEEIIVPTSVGNHARTTEKRRVATNVQNSYEWILYNFLAKHYEDNEQVRFKLSRGYHNIVDVYGYKIRFHHGENVRYQGGVGGLTIPLNKAIKAWNEANQVDLDVIGHWHQLTFNKKFIVNGSIVGYNAYAESIKAEFERPQQAFFLMHPRYGKTIQAPIFVD